MVADNPAYPTVPCPGSPRQVSRRHRILACVVFLTSCGGCQETSPVTAVQEPAPPSLEIAPKGISLVAGESLRFTATVGGTAAQGVVRWLASGGLIDQTGLFRAGEQAGTYEVRAEIETSLGLVTDASGGSISAPSLDEPADEGIDGISGGQVLFQDDFETNQFRHWSGLAPAGDPLWSGVGAGGAHIGDGYITDEQAHSGRLAWKALVDPTKYSYGKADKSSLERWQGMRGIEEFYVSAWYFIPTDYPAVASNIMQIKASGPDSYKPVALYLRRDRTFAVYSGILGRNVLATKTMLPVGRWFNLTGRFVIADYGLVEAWLDGQKIASVRTDTKDSQDAYFGVGNYISDYPITSYLYIDDVRVTAPAPP